LALEKRISGFCAESIQNETTVETNLNCSSVYCFKMFLDKFNISTESLFMAAFLIKKASGPNFGVRLFFRGPEA